MRNQSSSESFREWSLRSLSGLPFRNLSHSIRNAVQRLRQRLQRSSKDRSGRERCNPSQHDNAAGSLLESSSETPQISRIEPFPPRSFSVPFSFLNARTGHRPPFTYAVQARLSHDDISRRRYMQASLDTQCQCNLMSRRIWDRLADGRQLTWEPCNSVVLPLDSAPVPVLGIARHVRWHLWRGPRTYDDDFLVIEMECFDLLIGHETIQRENLLSLSGDLSFRRSRVQTV